MCWDFTPVFWPTTVLRIILILLSALGWDILNFATEEVENPRLVLPIAALCGIGISAAIYLLMNVAYFSVISLDEFMLTETVAVVRPPFL